MLPPYRLAAMGTEGCGIWEVEAGEALGEEVVRCIGSYRITLSGSLAAAAAAAARDVVVNTGVMAAECVLLGPVGPPSSHTWRTEKKISVRMCLSALVKYSSLLLPPTYGTAVHQFPSENTAGTIQTLASSKLSHCRNHVSV